MPGFFPYSPYSDTISRTTLTLDVRQSEPDPTSSWPLSTTPNRKLPTNPLQVPCHMPWSLLAWRAQRQYTRLLMELVPRNLAEQGAKLRTCRYDLVWVFS